MKKFTTVDLVLSVICMMLVTYSFTTLKFKHDVQASQDYTYNDDTFEKLSVIKAELEKKYLNDIDDDKLVEGAINGMLEALGDSHTRYFNKQDAEQFLIETEGEYDGVGIYVTYDESEKMVIVLTPMEGTPAAEAGVLPGDYIEFVDGVDVTDCTLDEVAGALKGKAGTIVKVGLIRYDKDDNSTRIEKTITRENINIDPIIGKVYENNIGYMKLTAFDETTYKEFKTVYDDLIDNKKVDGLILDLRNNPGGILDVATRVADLLLPKGQIVYTVDKNGLKESIYSNSKKIEVPLVVLINEGSASASEVLAGAIKDYGIGKIVGVKSYGKGVIQTLVNLHDGTYIKVTTNEYFSPKGNKIDGEGITPDVVVELPEDIESYHNLKLDEDIQLQTAIEELKKMM